MRGTFVFTYLVVFAVFIFFIIMVPNQYVYSEQTYIQDAEQSLNAALEQTTIEARQTAIAQTIADFPMEIVVYYNNEVIYNTTNIANPTAMLLQGSVNQAAVLMEKQGAVETTSGAVSFWYSLYQMPTAKALLNNYFIGMIIFTTILFVLLLAFIAYIQWVFFKPLNNLKDSLAKAEMNSFDSIEVVHDDVINRKFKQFTTKVSRFSSNVLKDYTELERDLENARGNLEANILYSRALVHDLKTPVHEIMMENEYKLLYGDANVDKEALAFNVAQSDAILNQLNDILTVLETGLSSKQSEMESLDVVALISEEKQKFYSSIRQKQLLLSVDQPEKLEVVSNRVSLKLLIHNVLSNAIAYAQPESEIEIELFGDAGEYTLICRNLTDPINVERIENNAQFFQAFSEQRSEREHQYSSGNGLYLIEELSRMLDGEYSLMIEENLVTIQIVFKELVDDETPAS